MEDDLEWIQEDEDGHPASVETLRVRRTFFERYSDTVTY
jgi:hypothetical protein